MLFARLPATRLPLRAAVRGRLPEALLDHIMDALSVTQVVDHPVQRTLEGMKRHVILPLGTRARTVHQVCGPAD